MRKKIFFIFFIMFSVLLISSYVNAYEQSFVLGNYGGNTFAYYQTLDNGDIELYTNSRWWLYVRKLL